MKNRNEGSPAPGGSRSFWPAARWAAVAVFAAAQLFLAADDTPVADEARHVRDGAVAWELGRINVNPEHPPLVKLLAAATLPAADRRMAIPQASPDPNAADPIAVDAQFAVRIRLAGGRLLRVRLPSIAIAILGLIAFGSLFEGLAPSAPFAATILLGAAPPWFANSHYVTTDVAPVAFLLLAAAVAKKCRGLDGAGAAGVCVGAALVSKFAAPLLVPFALAWIVLCARERGRSGSRVAFAGLVAVLSTAVVLFAVEGFASRGMAVQDLRAVSHQGFLGGGLGGPAPPSPQIDAFCSSLAGASRPLAAYAIGFLSVAHRSRSAAGADYWAGSIVTGAQPLYPLETLLFKNDLPLLALAMLGAVLLIQLRHEHAGLGVAIAVSGVALYVALACRSSLHLGVRHLLPAVALFAGFGAFAVTSTKTWSRLAFWALAAAHVLTAALAFPHLLSYRNVASRLVVPPERMWDLGDDWGQDLGRALRTQPDGVAYVSVLQYRAPHWRALFPKLAPADADRYPCLVDRVAIDIADAARRTDLSPVMVRELAGIRPILDRVERLRGSGSPRATSEPTVVRFEERTRPAPPSQTP